MTTLTLTNGKKVRGVWNGKIYGNTVYINPIQGSYYIDICDVNGEWFTSSKKTMKIEVSEIVDLPSRKMPKTVEEAMAFEANA